MPPVTIRWTFIKVCSTFAIHDSFPVCVRLQNHQLGREAVSDLASLVSLIWCYYRQAGPYPNRPRRSFPHVPHCSKSRKERAGLTQVTEALESTIPAFEQSDGYAV